MGQKSKSRRTRKHRRQMKAVLKHGPEAKPTHKARGGRTGRIMSNRIKSLQRSRR